MSEKSDYHLKYIIQKKKARKILKNINPVNKKAQEIYHKLNGNITESHSLELWKERLLEL